VADAVRAALAAVAVRDGQPEACLVKALEDKAAVKRAAAGEALLRAGVKEQHEAVRRLLKDPDATVRLRVALALVRNKNRQAVPVLIDLLGRLPPAETGLIEDILYRLAGDQAPTVTLGSKTPAENVREAWAAWWTKHGDSVDLSHLTDAREQLGYTLVVQMENGKVQELDAKGQLRWQIQGLMYPLSAQVLREDRVLIAEYRGNRVCERDFKGDIKWEHRVTWPVAAQRFPNGHTFIATRNQLLELDREGKEVFSFPLAGQILAAAQKLRNGQIVCVTSAGLVLRLDAAGKELKRFSAGFALNFGVGIDALDNGHVLLALYRTNKVVEFDAEGKALWEATVPQPDAAVRLPNGNTLVACKLKSLLVELDREGRMVWQLRVDGRPVRGSRR
jgi:hypothetical protein